ncbi:hypothetical protein TSUD_412310 [Trifolium subterraneum]|uniref:Integrase catalytic domain-containing protein n=1 Tax=Trifolium subterraneum TaxID=3900 RepID=A0A2Z6PKH3_TRISU|nr:hypothetical protein TSUD_412310 [Trifolium subterraneum]
MDREGGYVTRPPLLDDSNYDIWKARMIAFLKSMDNRTWKAVLKGWEHPKVKDVNGADTDELKPEEEWTAAEDSLALGNSKALNALFNGVDKNMFRLIKTCEVAKDAWEILKTTQEGTAKVKISRLQNLTRKFENLRMKKDESVHNFYMNVMDFANSFDDLGEKLSDEKIVRKILRSLTKKFDMKVIAMEEAQDISTMKVDELIGSLQTYESSVNERLEKKNKSIAFVSNTEDEDLESDMESTDSVSEAIFLLGRQFNKVLKRMDRRPRQNGRHLATDMSRNIGNSRKTKIDEKPAQKEEGESEVAKHVTVLTGIVTSDTESCDEEVSYDELAETYKDLCLIDDLHKKVNSLASDLDEANEEIDKLKVDIGRLRKYSEMLNKTGADTLDEILEKNVRRPKFTSISYENVNKHRSYNPELMYTQPKESPMSSKMLQHPKQHHGVRYKTKSHPWLCHYCGRKGHIRPFCYKLYGYPNRKPRQSVTPKEWKPKTEDGELLMKGIRSEDNCYLWAPQEDTNLSTCLIAKEDEVKLWHQRLGHLNLKSMKKAISEEAIRGIKHELSYPITPQQNGVVERKNRTLQESARAMLHAKKLPYSFWAEAMNTACYIHNKVTLRSGTTTTLYELWKNKKPTVKYFHIFGSKCHILADREQRRKLDPKSDEEIFLGYSSNSRAYRVFNSRTKVIMESSNVVVDDSAKERSTDVADDAIASDIQFDEPDIVEEVENSIESFKPDPTSIDPTNDPPKKGPSIRVQKTILRNSSLVIQVKELLLVE